MKFPPNKWGSANEWSVKIGEKRKKRDYGSFHANIKDLERERERINFNNSR